MVTAGHARIGQQEVPPMQYLILIYDEETANPSPEPPDPAVSGEILGQYNAYTEMLKSTGAFVAGEALRPVTTATTIREKDGQTIVTDGPFAETKEGLGGFYLIQAPDLDAAIALAAQCPGARYGSIEVRPVVDYEAAEASMSAGTASAN
jgi:hypothetical protein